MNQKGVPHLFVGSGAAKWADPKRFPWSIGWLPSYQNEGRIYAEYILKNYPGKTAGILYQNDDFGKDYLIGFQEGLGAEKAKVLVAEVPFEVTAPTVDSQVVQVKAANPDIFVNVGTPKFAAQAIKKIGEMNWTPVQFITNVSTSLTAVLRPAGLDYSKGLISAAYLKDPNDPKWAKDPGMNEFRSFMAKWSPDGDPADASTVYGYGVAKTLEQVLRQCGDDLTRANLMRQAANLDMTIGVTLPGVRIKTSPTDFSPIEQVQLMRFTGTTWELFGSLMGGE
jgi:ABC-type branched-subunit amino acid transport system substrate-binding protein